MVRDDFLVGENIGEFVERRIVALFDELAEFFGTVGVPDTVLFESVPGQLLMGEQALLLAWRAFLDRERAARAPDGTGGQTEIGESNSGTLECIRLDG
jgi:hypothetical protein